MGKLYRGTIVAGGLAAALVAVAALGTAARAADPPRVQPSSAPAQAQGSSLLSGLPPAALGGRCLRSGGAFLRARIRGAVRLDVDLRGRELTCEGGPRLDGSGIRMGFEGRAGSAGRVRMIFGIDHAKEGRAGRELPTNLTVFFEDRKLLFATQGGDNCTVDRLTQEPVSSSRAATSSPRAGANVRAQAAPQAHSASAGTYRIVAHGFCIAPANDLSGRQRILVTTFDFAGRADFNAP